MEIEDHIHNCEDLPSVFNSDSEKVKFNFVCNGPEQQKRAVEAFRALRRKREILLELKKVKNKDYTHYMALMHHLILCGSWIVFKFYI